MNNNAEKVASAMQHFVKRNSDKSSEYFNVGEISALFDEIANFIRTQAAFIETAESERDVVLSLLNANEDAARETCKQARADALRLAAKIAADEEGHFTWAGEDKNVRMLQQCARQISEAILKEVEKA